MDTWDWNDYYNDYEESQEVEREYSDSLYHIGVSVKDGAEIGSGRYRLGSGENPFQHLEGLHSEYQRLTKMGLKAGEIAKQMGMSVPELRARNEYYVDLKKNRDIAKAVELADKGMKTGEIAKKLGVSVTTANNLLKASTTVRKQKITATREALKSEIERAGGMIDVGKGIEARMGIKKTALDAAVITLRDEGYELYPEIRVRMGGTDNFVNMKVLAAPGTTKADVYKNKDKIGVVNAHSSDGGLTVDTRKPPINVPLSRVDIRYADDPISGADYDGVIELRRGVPDLSLGNAHYAQVRIAIDAGKDGKKYAKGMAVYADDLPDGVDIRVNSNKTRAQGVNKALKEQKDDPMDPFGSSFHFDDNGLYTATTTYEDPKTGEKKQSALNFVNDEGTWEHWDKNLPSQFLGKQSIDLAKQQLNIDASVREREFDEIRSLTNPVLREKMLMDFSETCDSAAVHLKAAALPRQQTHVLLPSRSIKPGEIYAPKYEDGEEVCLVRFPHGGIFEIPRLKVNNRNREAKKMVSNEARDAVCINPETAKILSGADFDGDTVLVLPTKKHDIKNRSPFDELKNFDPHTQYACKDEEEAKKIGVWKKGSDQEGLNMGLATNLITDMTFQGATDDELIRATKYSMVVIDTGKHRLNYKQAFKDLRIDELQKKYQNKGINPKTGREQYGGASTLLSRTTSEYKVFGRKSYPKIDPETGEKIPIPDTTMVPHRKKIGGEWQTVYELRGRNTTQGAEAKDAYTITSGGSKKNPGTAMEAVYADYANRLKALANRARKEAVSSSKATPVSKTAKAAYANEINSLRAKLNEAKKNAPLERKALALAEVNVNLAKQAARASGGMGKAEVKKMLDKEVKKARKIVGAERYMIKINDREWEAIQSGAVTKSDQKQIFRFADSDQLIERARPKNPKKLSSSMLATARSMLDAGYTWDEVAKQFDVSTSTLSNNLNGG